MEISEGRRKIRALEKKVLMVFGALFVVSVFFLLSYNYVKGDGDLQKNASELTEPVIAIQPPDFIRNLEVKVETDAGLRDDHENILPSLTAVNSLSSITSNSSTQSTDSFVNIENIDQ